MGRAEEQAERQLYEMLRQKQQSDKEDDLGDFLETLTADEALHLACQCMEELLHPKQSSGGSSNNVIHWQSVTLDFTVNRYKPKRIIQRGAFLPPHKDTKTDKS